MKKILILFPIVVLLIFFLVSNNKSSHQLEKDKIRKEETKIKKTKGHTAKLIKKSSHKIKKNIEQSNSQNSNNIRKNELSVVFNINSSFDDREYFNTLIDSYEDGNYLQSLTIAKNILLIPDKYSDEWWYGDLIHMTNIVLANIYLKKGDIEECEKYLNLSVSSQYIDKTRHKEYSPSLYSFGPDTEVAFELYKKGRRDSIIQYFLQTKQFWKSGIESGEIDRAIRNINNNVQYDERDVDLPFQSRSFIRKL